MNIVGIKPYVIPETPFRHHCNIMQSPEQTAINEVLQILSGGFRISTCQSHTGYDQWRSLTIWMFLMKLKFDIPITWLKKKIRKKIQQSFNC